MASYPPEVLPHEPYSTHRDEAGRAMMSLTLSVDEVNLRPFQENDASDVLAYWQSDPGWEKFNASVPRNFDANDASAFVQEMRGRDRQIQPNWAIEFQGAVVGVVSLTFEQQFRVAVIGYGVHGNIRGRGLSGRATTCVLDNAFGQVPQLERVRAHTNAENHASHRVLEKLGFQREGLLRSNQYVKDRFVDETIYGLLRHEWQNLK